MDAEQVIMGIIVNAGQARSLYFDALNDAKNGQFERAEQKLQEAKGFISEAHHVQTALIEEDEGQGKIPMTLIMVHAQDHLMTSMLAGELVQELIALYQRQSD
ncbi:PTS lactose/cellobiose transporter subunit IIA [Celerinatantimonas sp. YJH-8]|uniref:PTS lactose/cellobiose transporter subunit IIA n=1 Tax=Celerinatantimonas sp. YJH-8 TaxID=3228714 RepID=UPI0038BEEBF3